MMQTIGSYLSQSRAQKNISKDRLEKETKIKKSFIEAIEKGEWESLPDYPVVLGFVKSITRTLEIDGQKAAALLRRDYPPKTLPFNPKPDVSEKFTWSPRVTFIVLSGLVAVLVLGYLSFQYVNFLQPPELAVEMPLEGQVVEGTSVEVTGKTDTDATITVNNQPVLVEKDGTFSVNIGISEETGEIVVRAVSRSGKEAFIHRNIRNERRK